MPEVLLPSNHNFLEVLLAFTWFDAMPNKMYFLLLSCCQVLSVQIACTLQLGLFHYRP